MSLKNPIAIFLTDIKKIAHTFVKSLFFPKSFLHNELYSRNINEKLYLYVALLSYLIYYSAIVVSYEISFFLKTIDRYTASVNIVELLFYTLPVYFICLSYSKIPFIGYKQVEKRRLYKMTVITFANILFLEVLLHFITLILTKCIEYFSEEQPMGDLVIGIGYIISILNNWLIKVIPIIVFCIILNERKVKIKWILFTFLPITIFANYFVFNLYRLDFFLLKDTKSIQEKRVQFFDQENMSSEYWDLKYRMLSPDTVEVYSNFFIKNNSNLDYYGKPDFSIRSSNKQIEHSKSDTLFIKFHNFFRDNNFNVVYINNKICTDYFTIKPKELIEVRALRRFRYDLVLAKLLQEISSPSFNSFNYSFLIDHDIVPISDNQDSNFVKRPKVVIQNFSEDWLSIKKYEKALETYKTADTLLGLKRNGVKFIDVKFRVYKEEKDE